MNNNRKSIEFTDFISKRFCVQTAKFTINILNSQPMLAAGYRVTG